MVGDVIMQRKEARWDADEAASLAVSGKSTLQTQAVQRVQEPESNDQDCSLAWEVDWARTARMGVYRTVVFAPIFSVFLSRLERAVKATGAKGVALKVVADQLVLQPPMLCLFYFTMTVFEGRPVSEGADRAADMLVPTLKLNIPFWTTVHLVTFSMIPAAYRVAWVSVIQCGWTSVMSHLNHRAALGQSIPSWSSI